MHALTKFQKINIIVLGVLAFVFFPVFTGLFIRLEPSLETSITRMLFSLGHEAVAIPWGIFIMVYLFYTFLLLLKESHYKKWLKTVLLVLMCCVDVLFILTGSCSVESPIDAVERTHNITSIMMFVGHFIVVGLLEIINFVRNKTSGWIGFGILFFFVYSTMFLFLECNEYAHGEATALSEGYSFMWVLIFFYLTYVGNIFFPTKDNAFIKVEATKKII